MSSFLSAITPRGRTRCSNMGGPRSRTRTERIYSTLLGQRDGIIRCPHFISLGLDFDALHPVERLERILAEEDFSDPEELRSVYTLPTSRLICSPLPVCTTRLPTVGSPRNEVLLQALMLGLCTAQLFDPERAVIWTATSLTRAVDLFEPGGFYA